MEKWIKCNDRLGLPANPKMVITAHCYNHSGIPTVVGTSRYYEKTGEWVSEVGFDDTNEITHWQPLPELSINMEKWTKCSDRLGLPTSPKMVITAHCYNHSGIPTAVGTSRYYEKTGKWVSEIGFDDTNEITHWQPLPELPKEG